MSWPSEDVVVGSPKSEQDPSDTVNAQQRSHEGEEESDGEVSFLGKD